MNTQFLKRLQFFLIFLILILIVGSVLAGWVFKWPNFYPFITLLRLIKEYGIAALCSLPVLGIGYWIKNRIIKDSLFSKPLPAFFLSWRLGWAFIVGIGILLLASGLYFDFVWVAFAGIGNLFVLAWVVKNYKNIAKWVRGFFKSDNKKQKKNNPFNWIDIFSVFITLIILFSVLAALLPPDIRDELTYHLVLPRLWGLQNNFMVPVDNLHWLFPANAEIIWGYGLASGGLHVPRILSLFFGLVTLVFIRWWLKEAGYDRWTIKSSLLFLLITPVVTVMLSVCYVEWLMIFFILMGWYMALKFLKTRNNKLAYLSGLFWAVAAGMKYTALLFIFLLCLDLIVIKYRNKTKINMKPLIISLIIALLIFYGTWIVRNAYLTGDPFYPLGGHVLSKIGIGAQEKVHEAEKLLSYSRQEGLWKWLPWIYHSTAERVVDHRMHIGWPVLLVMVILIGWRMKTGKPWLSVVISSIVLLIFSPSPRVYFPVMMLAFLFLPDMFHYLRENRWLKTAVSWGLVILLISSLPWIYYFSFMTFGKNAQEYFLGRINDEAILKRNNLLTPVIQSIREKTPYGTRIWAWGEESVFYLDRWVRSSSYLDKPGFIKALEKGGSASIDELINSDSIHFILVNHRNCPVPVKAVRSEAKIWRINSEHQKELHRWMQNNLEKVARDKKHILYRVIQ